MGAKPGATRGNGGESGGDCHRQAGAALAAENHRQSRARCGPATRSGPALGQEPGASRRMKRLRKLEKVQKGS